MWGYNDYGALGDGTTMYRASPTPVAGLSGAQRLSTAGHSVALKADGTVWTWGTNFYGELGDGTTTARSTPAQVTGLGNIIGVATGPSATMALGSDRLLYAWGNNWYGQLGDGTTTDRPAPVQITGVSAVAGVSISSHTVAVKTDGTVWAWGPNWYGQLGDGTQVSRTVPAAVPSLAGFVAASAGISHTLALKSDGTVWAWGDNHYGQLGDGTTTGRALPVQIAGLINIVFVLASSSSECSMAIKSDGSLWVWGRNLNGQLGLSGAAQFNTPVQVPLLNGVATVGMGAELSAARKSDGSVWTWGWAGSGGLGYDGNGVTMTAIRLIASSTDTDQDGMSDAWELQYFGNLNQNGGEDPDGDGLTNIQEFVRGTNPTQANPDGDSFTDFADLYPNDYYNGVTPTLSILGGNNQVGFLGEFNAQPFDVAVTIGSPTNLLANAPLVFSVSQGGGLLSTANTGNPTLYTSLSLRTGFDGTAHVYYKQPAAPYVDSIIGVTGGGAQATFYSRSSVVGDADGNQLPDAWESLYFGQTGQTATADPDGDGLTNLQEYQLGRNPTKGAVSDTSGALNLRLYTPGR
jgi:alpha-tubulin suppressor-like RCC1 family protein